MKTSLRTLIILLLGVLSTAQVRTQTDLLCQGAYWTEQQGNLKMKEFASQWSDKATWEQRAEIIRRGIVRGMEFDKMPDHNFDFDPIIHSTRELDGYVVENIAIVSFPGFYITGNLYRPASYEGRIPAILSPHGHFPDARFTESIQTRAAVLARMGAIVFTYDMIGYGESTQVEHRIPKTLLLQTWNSQRVLEYLISRNDVDPSRIGITGASGGGTQTFLLTAIDDRIAASVPVVMVSAHFFGGCIGESGMPIHRSTSHQTNNVEIAALCAPRPMMVISDGADWTRNNPRVEIPYLKRVYAQYDAEHLLEPIHLPNERHDYGYGKRAPMYIFFAHHLGLSTGRVPFDGGVDESFVKILPRESLTVFNDDHPRPTDALIGEEALMNYLGFD